MTENDRKTSSLRPYCVLTGCLLIPHPVRHLELFTNKGTKTRVKHRTWWGGENNRRHKKTQKELTY